MIPILLMMVAIILFAFFAPIGILVTLILVFIKDSRERFARFADYPYGIAHTIDILGNIVCGELFNIVLIKHGGYSFGVRTETISSVLGKNKRANTLTAMGKIIAHLLDTIDANHCIKSVQIIPSYLLKTTDMNNYFFLLPHLNCQIMDIDAVPLNIPVQQMQAPFEPFAENGFFGVILWNQAPAQKVTYTDLITNEVKEADIQEFVGARPDPRR